MGARPFQRVGHRIQIKGRFIPEPGTGNPAEMSIGHHHEGPCGAALIDVAAQGDVLAPSDGDHSLVRLDTPAEILVARVQKTR